MSVASEAVPQSPAGDDEPGAPPVEHASSTFRPGSIRSRWRRRGPAQAVSPRIALAQFALGSLVVIILLVVVGGWILHNAAIEEGINDASALADTQVRFVVQPSMTDGLVQEDTAAVASFDRTVRSLLLEPGVARIKLWRLDGHILYSDDSRLIGQRFILADDDLEAVRTGLSATSLVDKSSPENILERSNPDTDLVQVYSKVTSPNGTVLLYEVYFELPAIAGPALANLGRLLPLFLVGLVALWLLQLPLAWRLVTRLRQSQDDREALHRKVIEASDNARRRIARDLHDGVVQSLAGISYSLSAVGDRLKDVAPPDTLRDIAEAADGTRDGVRELRTMILEIYPPNIDRLGINAVLTDLLTPLAAAGIETQAALADEQPMSRDVASVIYRAAQESIRNAATHSQAASVALSLGYDEGLATLVVRDNGVGFDPATRRDDGRPHFGLLLMGELVAEAGGDVVVDSAPGWGTTVVVEVPLR
jgi:signal transduction histidine kinase